MAGDPHANSPSAIPTALRCGSHIPGLSAGSATASAPNHCLQTAKQRITLNERLVIDNGGIPADSREFTLRAINAAATIGRRQ
jgi:hypothetical protein